MAEVEVPRISEMFNYLNSETYSLGKANGAFVFGRADPLVAERAALLYRVDLIDYVMVTGGVGKDSGWLADFSIPEAAHQGSLLVGIHGFPPENLYLEQRATNSGDCCKFGLDTLSENDLPHDNLIVVAHPTSLRRVEAVLQNEVDKRGFTINFQRTGTKYRFDPRNLIDQKEAVGELIRLADWPNIPAKRDGPWAVAQDDLPEDLVAYARELDAAWKTE